MKDLIVIGAGSGGLVAAKRAASYGKKVLLCENDTIGGTCVSYGCVPKKLWHIIAHFKQSIDMAREHGWEIPNAKFNWQAIQPKLKQYINALNDRHEKKCLDHHVMIERGTAKFIDKSTIEINKKTYTAKHILVAVGSTASKLSIPGSELCETSKEFFSWTKQPKKVVIIGGGYIAMELGSILNAIGTDVHIVIRRDLILRGFDLDLRHYLQDQYRKKGITIHTEVSPESCKRIGDEISVRISNGKELRVNKVIQAVGRQANTESLNCEKAEIKVSNKGVVSVDEQYRSTNPNIYAIGDCIDRGQLTPVAIAQARQWVDMMFTQSRFPVSFKTIPTAIFSLPEAAVVGLTEEEARERYEKQGTKVQTKIQTKIITFNPLSSALTEKESHHLKEKVMMKLILEGEEENVVGIHMGGENVSEIIQSLAVAVQKGIKKKDLDLTMALHPTVTEELVTQY